MIVASCLEMRASSAWLIEVLLALGAGDLVDVGQHRLEVAELLQQRPTAVLSPMPGTPGMLSEVSPLRP